MCAACFSHRQCESRPLSSSLSFSGLYTAQKGGKTIVTARRYVMEDLHNVGGTPGLLKYLLEQNIIDGSCMTCTTHTLATNLEQCPPLKEGQDVVLPTEKPVKATGHLQILYGNLAPEGSVAKITGKEGLQFSGPAAVYDGPFHRLRSPCQVDLVPPSAHIGNSRTSSVPSRCGLGEYVAGTNLELPHRWWRKACHGVLKSNTSM
jgi:hypothetical protein